MGGKQGATVLVPLKKAAGQTLPAFRTLTEVRGMVGIWAQKTPCLEVNRGFWGVGRFID